MLSCNKEKSINQEVRDIDKVANALGIQYGYASKEFMFDQQAFQAFIDGIHAGRKDSNAPSSQVKKQAKSIDSIVLKYREEKAKKNKMISQKFMSDILSQEMKFKKTKSGLVYKIIKKGKKIDLAPEQILNIRFRSSKLNGNIYQDNSAISMKMPLKGMLKAWQEAFSICGLRCQIKIIAPSNLTYGDTGSPPVIDPGEGLIFTLYFESISSL